MRTLIIHPEDPTTTFLHGIYKDLTNKTVINGGITKDELRKHIDGHDRVLMLGHGVSTGLFSVDQFPITDSLIIDASMIESLRKKTNNVFIWCYADQFVTRHFLNGFSTGMFISEPAEALHFGYWQAGEDLIDESNYEFSRIVSKYLNKPLDILYKNVLNEYGILAKTNPIAKYNHDRLCLNHPEPCMISDKLDKILELLSGK